MIKSVGLDDYLIVAALASSQFPMLMLETTSSLAFTEHLLIDAISGFLYSCRKLCVSCHSHYTREEHPRDLRGPNARIESLSYSSWLIYNTH